MTSEALSQQICNCAMNLPYRHMNQHNMACSLRDWSLRSPL
jgi:hypothetical protein